jgi:membrane-bound serine protease (ClpP class)
VRQDITNDHPNGRRCVRRTRPGEEHDRCKEKPLHERDPFCTVPDRSCSGKLAGGILTTVKRALIFVMLASLAAAGSASARSGRVLAVKFDADVNPVTQKWLSDRIDDGASYDAIVILLDTPGGLEDSMRKIVQDELRAKEPVVVYVAPNGARAASAGVWIAEAADVLAMAPVSNIGSSTPITNTGGNIGSDLKRKILNDAAASLRNLARAHGRNAKWADLAVRKASNLTADEALSMNVIDLISPNLPTLLRTIDGRHVKLRNLTLHTAGDTIVTKRMGFLTRLLDTLIDPNLLSLLFLAGIGGLLFEVFHPGVVLPGALGAVSLVTALFGFSILPTSWAGVALIVLGLALLVIDAHVVTHGALTVSGLVALVVGMLMLFHDAPAPYKIRVWFVVAVAASIGGFMAVALGKAVQARRRPSAMPAMVGAEGVVRNDGLVFVRGELWQASTDDGSPLEPGTRIRVDEVQGLRLRVRRV